MLTTLSKLTRFIANIAMYTYLMFFSFSPLHTKAQIYWEQELVNLSERISLPKIKKLEKNNIGIAYLNDSLIITILNSELNTIHDTTFNAIDGGFVSGTDKSILYVKYFNGQEHYFDLLEWDNDKFYVMNTYTTGQLELGSILLADHHWVLRMAKMHSNGFWTGYTRVLDEEMNQKAELNTADSNSITYNWLINYMDYNPYLNKLAIFDNVMQFNFGYYLNIEDLSVYKEMISLMDYTTGGILHSDSAAALQITDVEWHPDGAYTMFGYCSFFNKLNYAAGEPLDYTFRTYDITIHPDSSYDFNAYGSRTEFNRGAKMSSNSTTTVFTESVPQTEAFTYFQEERKVNVYLKDYHGVYDTISLFGDKNHLVQMCETNELGDVFIGGVYSNEWSDKKKFTWVMKIPAIALQTAKVENQPLHLEIYPNPTTDFVRIKGNLSPGTIYIYDMKGTLVQQGYYNGNDIDVALLQSGNYLLSIQNANGISTKLFIKK